MKNNFNKKRDTSWNEVSKWYDALVGEKGSDYHENVIIPNTLKLLAPSQQEKIIDIACGQGVFTRRLAEKALEVWGIDASEKLIKIAKERSQNKPGQKYMVLNAEKLLGIENNYFDSATSIMAFQNIENADIAIKEASRVLKTGGKFVFVISHPCFRIPRQSGWGFDEKRKLQYRRLDIYLSELKIPIQMHPGYNPGVVTWTFHRPISSYMSYLNSAGFAVSHLEEWVSHRKNNPGKNQKAENKARDEFPLFMAVKAVKVV